MTTTNSSNVRKRLKTATAISHQRLDDMMSARGPFDSIENYGWYLRGMDALYLHCDSSIRWAELQAGLGTHEPSLRHLIETDLTTVNSQHLISQPSTVENARELDAATCWAQAYVMEGSAIGASFMIRSAKRKLSPEVGLTFMTRLADDAKDRWPKFAAALCDADIDADQAVQAANAVFDRAYEIFAPTET